MALLVVAPGVLLDARPLVVKDVDTSFGDLDDIALAVVVLVGVDTGSVVDVKLLVRDLVEFQPVEEVNVETLVGAGWLTVGPIGRRAN